MLILLATLAALGASTMGGKVTKPASGPVVWRPIPDPANPGQFLTSALAGGTVLAIEAKGLGERVAIWSASSLQAGYYKIEILYPRHSGNAQCVLVLTKGTLDAGYKAFTKRLDQRVGDNDKTISNVFVRTSTNVTTGGTNNATNYIWVGNNATNKPYTGTLAVQLSDSGCQGGRIVADFIRITLISTVK